MNETSSFRRWLVVAGIILLVPSVLLLIGEMSGMHTNGLLPDFLQFRLRTLGSFAVAGCLMAAIGSIEP